MTSRRKARETVLRVLYLCESHNITAAKAFAEMEAVEREIAETVDESVRKDLKPFALGLNEKQMTFAQALAQKIEDSKGTLNDHIKEVLQNWDFSRIARIDRIILWIALAEMSSMPDIPVNVSINEAIELAKKFSSHRSPAFINGILDAVAKKL